MHRERKRRNLILFSLLGILLLMIGGYAAFQSKLDIKGSTKVTTNWEVLITNVTSGTPTGNAENSKDENDNVILPTWDGLSASMSADLYEAGDSMEYIVTVTNRGNLDATLDKVLKTDSSNSAVIITYSGYAEKQKLRKNSSMDIKVKVEYNPEYTGGEVTGSSNITFSFKEADSKLDNDEKPIIENDTIISKDDKTITYDCTENGGTGNQTSIFDIGSPVDLSVNCSKEGYTFLGWNTDKNATSVISDNSSKHTTLNNKTTDTTLYGIYSKTIDITYTYGEGVTSISKNSDTCTIYNKITSCDKTLPTVTLDNDADNTYYELNGFYIEDVFIGNQSESYSYTDSVTVNASMNTLPVMMSGPNFQTKIDSVKSTITEIEFVDTDEVTPPTIDNITSFDVSAKQNGSVIAWLDGTKLYIGGKGGVIGNSDCFSLFRNMNNVVSIDFNNKFDTSKVTTMNRMFYDCHNIEELDLSSFDTSNVTNMFGMFDDIDGTGTSKLKKITFGNKWNTSKVTSMKNMFCDCHSLEELDISMFDTSNVEDMIGMFARCYKLTSLDLSNFNTNNVTTMEAMFLGSYSFTKLNLSSFNTRNITNMYNMFYNCKSLTTIYASENFVTTNVTDSTNMFLGASNLVGGNGTSYADKLSTDSANAKDKTYALIDKENQEGYFTDGSVPVIRSVNNVTSSNSITLTVDAYVPNGDEISKIEYSIDGGSTWYEQTNSSIAGNIYTFTNLDANTNYPIQIRVTSENNKVKKEEYEVKTKALQAPTYEETDDDEVTITYPSGCGSTYICSYKIDNGNEVTVNSTSAVVTYTHAGTLTGYVKDKDTSGNALNIVSSTYNLTWSDLYVASTGNDTTGYGTLSAPYATMNKAYQSARDTSTIYIMDDITVTETTNLNSNKDITLTSSDSSGNIGSSIVNSVIRGGSLTNRVLNERSGEITLENITIDGNNVESDTSMLQFLSNAMIGTGAIIKNAVSNYENGAAVRVSGAQVTLTLDGGEISNNKGISSTNSHGGGIFVASGANLIINSGSIKDNSSLTNGGGIESTTVGKITINGGEILNNTASSGGGIHARYILNISGGTISGNTASSYGGGIFASSTATTNINGGTISGNQTTTQSGGGIYAYGTLNMTSGTISNNTAYTYGGGIICKEMCTMTGGTISGNTATTQSGGGIRVDGTFTLEGGTISSNIATDVGGGISANGEGNVTISNTALIDGNEARIGGGIGIGNGKILNISGNVKILNNESKWTGGGLYINNGNAAIENVLIDGNITTGPNAGASITLHYASLTLNNGTISNNISSTGDGGGIRVDDSSFTMNGGTIIKNSGNTKGAGIGCIGTSDINSMITINGGKIYNNTATTSNGGIFIGNYCTYTNTNNQGVICENTPTNEYETHTTCPAS